MPVYTYHCDNCNHEFDKHQSFSEETLVVCPSCRKHRLRKVYSPAGVVFKGSGFYVTDKKRSATSSKPAPSKAKSNGKEKAKSTESKVKDKPAKTSTVKEKSS
jgi:putative FmdB family regulatory protein